MRLSPLFLLPLLMLAVGAAPADRYVPADGWGDGAQADRYEQWFGGQLRAMNEPVLSGPNGLGRYRQRFRMLVLPTFRPGYAIRVDEGVSAARVHLVRLDGLGGFAPGRIARRREISLDQTAMAELDRLIRTADLDRLTRDAPAVPEGTGTITICVDGTEFVFELVNRDGRHFVARHDCTITPELWALGREIDALVHD